MPRERGLNRKIEAYALANPEATPIEIAAKFNCGTPYVRATSYRLGFKLPKSLGSKGYKLKDMLIVINTLKDEKAARDDLIQCLIDNDPDEPIADGGHTVLDLWRHDARKMIGEPK